jgi:hypothetical protein
MPGRLLCLCSMQRSPSAIILSFHTLALLNRQLSYLFIAALNQSFSISTFKKS